MQLSLYKLGIIYNQGFVQAWREAELSRGGGSCLALKKKRNLVGMAESLYEAVW